MNTEKSNPKTRPKKAGDVIVQQTGSGIHFVITEECWRDDGNGKMVCLATNETIEKPDWESRGKGTFLKVNQRG
jgi:hypothetical protein